MLITPLPPFNKTVSRLVLDHIRAHPEEWDQRHYHCGSAHCYMGLCDIFLGKHKKENGNFLAQDTIHLMGLFGRDCQEFIDISNTLARLEALHAFHSTGVYGVDGYDTDGLDRQGFDVDGFDVDGLNAMGIDRHGVSWVAND